MPAIASSGPQPFPELAAFMGGWFHQDFDIHATTREFLLAIRDELVRLKG